MADFDKLSDSKGIIINFIEKQVRELFNGEGTEFDFSLWIQAALLFEQVIIPCDYYVPETLLEFAQEVIDEAKSHECKVERYQVDENGEKANSLSLSSVYRLTTLAEFRWISPILVNFHSRTTISARFLVPLSSSFRLTILAEFR